VIENRGASQGAAPALYCAKVSAKLDGNKYTMHHQVIILDDNVLIIDSPAVASLYEREFATVYGQAKDQSGVDCAKAA